MFDEWQSSARKREKVCGWVSEWEGERKRKRLRLDRDGCCWLINVPILTKWRIKNLAIFFSALYQRLWLIQRICNNYLHNTTLFVFTQSHLLFHGGFCSFELVHCVLSLSQPQPLHSLHSFVVSEHAKHFTQSFHLRSASLWNIPTPMDWK